MATPTVSWNENSPAGSDNINAGDNRIREMKTQIREVIDVDHDFPSSGQATDVGQHKQVTLQEQADIGTGAVSATILGSQTIDGKGELVYTDEDDNDIQITNAGALNVTAAFINNLVYPVGSIYANASDSTNPNTLLGVGTWVAIEEEVIAGYKAGGTFDPVGSLAEGEETHTLTEAEMPAHTHGVDIPKNSSGGLVDEPTGSAGENKTYTSASTGGDTAHNNIQPTYVAYLWRRTA